MNMKLLEMNNMILMLGEQLRQVNRSLALATGHQLVILSAERDELLREYTELCNRTTTLIA